MNSPIESLCADRLWFSREDRQVTQRHESRQDSPEPEAATEWCRASLDDAAISVIFPYDYTTSGSHMRAYSSTKGMSSSPSYILIALFLLILSIGCKEKDQAAPALTPDTTTQAETERPKSRDSVVVMLVGVDSTTVLELLDRDHDLRYKSTSMGAFVEAIDSIEQSSNAFWMYSVNDSMIPMASDKRYITTGDTVRWMLKVRP
ncbi:MAG: DUF4430 domain-containing protein [candidate division Zixibacteria bacterium]|nr:DUF4430 domain-containing protein [candidate division Zixibacteria bacterium]